MNAQDIVDEETRRFHVANTMFCQITQAVLDVRTAVMIESSDGSKVYAVLSPEGWAIRKDALLASAPNLRITNAPAEKAPAPPAIAPLADTDEFMCCTCGFSATGDRDERDEEHLRFDGAHEANWVRDSDGAMEYDIPESIDA